MEEIYLKIKEMCLASKTTNPTKLVTTIMNEDFIHIHGPEHHILDGACLLSAIFNAGLSFNLENALDEMICIGKQMPGATCEKWGICGSSASIGEALSIIYKTDPLSHDQYYKDHLNLTSKILNHIALIGGPRCCKRNAFIALQMAIDFVNETYSIQLTKSEIKCTFSNKNQQCLHEACPFFQNEY